MDAAADAATKIGKRFDNSTCEIASSALLDT